MSKVIDLDGDAVARVMEAEGGDAFVCILVPANPEAGLGPQEVRLGGPLLYVGLMELADAVAKIMAGKDLDLDPDSVCE